MGENLWLYAIYFARANQDLIGYDCSVRTCFRLPGCDLFWTSVGTILLQHHLSPQHQSYRS